MKKILALVLALVLSVAGTASYAAETSREDPVSESYTVSSEKDESASKMWNSGTYTVPPNTTITTSNFYVSDPYFAFETRATTLSGGTLSGSYRVTLKYGSATIASATNLVNGDTLKLDWISIPTSGNYHFEITNYNSVSIKVYLTYYSWT